MRSSARIVIIALLSLLLPLQGTLAYARAVSMTAGMGGPQVVSEQAGTPSADPAVHTGHHHPGLSNADSYSHTHLNKPAPPRLFAISAGHHGAHQSSGQACDNCAKCCLAGAAAPPLIWLPEPMMGAARVLFIAASDTLSCFIPDGPERPPRCL